MEGGGHHDDRRSPRASITRFPILRVTSDDRRPPSAFRRVKRSAEAAVAHNIHCIYQHVRSVIHVILYNAICKRLDDRRINQMN